ncbi:MAG: ABC transporter substrate-binding protein [Deltaproteobacteria bacterium]|jgi:branched-chain amino acid transport system substrate-binding protein|nr:ABC transporter substrate-binding protein [Deltaproteobacteria bacterium]MBT4644727.1 ABC transporter substrate-binding protein [Deltaproteobacteria bacterium]MBT6504692.1 ABC transporter substrate-binding protein [Deltaproteobacteria bacterium]MBT7153892.1 ABC transporter substrate-binding protein [Deltaproteobacteria bacterium]MBT7710335.1 ABC transporter substrate-binding protein [Deltaproteobacteria bacterium]
MMLKKWMKMVLGSAALAVFGFGMSGQATADTLHIGAVLDFVSYSAPFDVPAEEGIRMAVEEINAAGGIGGKTKIKLSIKDYRGEPGPAVAGTKELLAKGVDVILGSGSAQATTVVGSFAKKKNVPVLTVTSSGPDIPTVIGPYGFTNTMLDNRQGAALAEYAIKKGYKTAYILRAKDDPYTDLLPAYFAEAFEKKGGKIVGTGAWTFAQQEFNVEVGKIKKIKPQPDIVMSATFGPFYAGLVTSLRGAGIKSVNFGADAIDEPSSIGLGAAAEGTIFTSAVYSTPGSSYAAFNKNYQKRYGKENTVAPPALGYDAVKLIEAAVLKAGSTNGKAIRDALDKLQNVQGASGKLTYLNGGRSIIRNVAICEVKNGKKVLKEWISPAFSDIPKAR